MNSKSDDEQKKEMPKTGTFDKPGSLDDLEDIELFYSDHELYGSPFDSEGDSGEDPWNPELREAHRGIENLKMRQERNKREEKFLNDLQHQMKLRKDPHCFRSFLKKSSWKSNFDVLLVITNLAEDFVRGPFPQPGKLILDVLKTVNPNSLKMTCFRETAFSKTLEASLRSHCETTVKEEMNYLTKRAIRINSLRNIIFSGLKISEGRKEQNMREALRDMGELDVNSPGPSEDLSAGEHAAYMNMLRVVLAEDDATLREVHQLTEEMILLQGNRAPFDMRKEELLRACPYMFSTHLGIDHCENFSGTAAQERKLKKTKGVILNAIPFGSKPQSWNPETVMRNFEALKDLSDVDILRLPQQDGTLLRHLLHDRILLTVAQLLGDQLGEVPHVDKRISQVETCLLDTEFSRLTPDLYFPRNGIISDVSFTVHPSESANGKHQKYDSLAKKLQEELKRGISVCAMCFSTQDEVNDCLDKKIDNTAALRETLKITRQIYGRIELLRGTDFLVPLNFREGKFDYKFEASSSVVKESLSAFRCFQQFQLNDEEIKIALKILMIDYKWNKEEDLLDDVQHRKLGGYKNTLRTRILLDLILLWSFSDLSDLPALFTSDRTLDMRCFLSELLCLAVSKRNKDETSRKLIMKELLRLHVISTDSLLFNEVRSGVYELKKMESKHAEEKTLADMLREKYALQTRALKSTDFRFFLFPCPSDQYLPVTKDYASDYIKYSAMNALITAAVREASDEAGFLFINPEMERQELIQMKLMSLSEEDQGVRAALKKAISEKTAIQRNLRKGLKTIRITEEKNRELWETLAFGPEKKRYKKKYDQMREGKMPEAQIRSSLPGGLYEKFLSKEEEKPLSLSLDSVDCKEFDDLLNQISSPNTGRAWSDPIIPMATEIDPRIEKFYRERLVSYNKKNFSRYFSEAGHVAREIVINCYRHRPRGNKKERRLLLSLTQDRRNFVLIYPGARIRDSNNLIWVMIMPIEEKHSKFHRCFEWLALSEHHLNSMISIERTMFAMYCHLTEVEPDSFAVDQIMAMMCICSLSLSKNVAETLKAMRNTLAKEYDVNPKAVRGTAEKYPDRLSSVLSPWLIRKLLSKKQPAKVHYDLENLDLDNPTFKSLRFFSWVSGRTISQQTFSLEMYMFFCCEKEVGVDKFHGLSSALKKLNPRQNHPSDLFRISHEKTGKKVFFGLNSRNNFSPAPGTFSNFYMLVALSNFKLRMKLDPTAVFSKFNRDFLSMPASSLASFKSSVRAPETSEDHLQYEISVKKFEILKKKALSEREKKRLESQKTSESEEERKLSLLDRYKVQSQIDISPEAERETVASLFGQFYSEKQMKEQNIGLRLKQLTSEMIDEDNEINWDAIQDLIELGKSGDLLSSKKSDERVDSSRLYFLKGRGRIPSEAAFRNFSLRKQKVIDWVYLKMKDQKISLNAMSAGCQRLTAAHFYSVLFSEEKLASRDVYDYAFFLKQQVGVREISISECSMMLRNRFCESISRSICSFVPCDYSDSGSTKDSNYSQNVRHMHKTLKSERSKGRHAILRAKSGDKKQWCINFPNFSVPLIAGFVTESEEVVKIMSEQSHYLSNRRYAHDYQTLKRKIKVMERGNMEEIEKLQHLFNDEELKRLRSGEKNNLYDLYIESKGSFPQGFLQMGSSLFHSVSVMLCERQSEELASEYVTSKVDQVSMLTSDDSYRVKVISSADSAFPEMIADLSEKFDRVTDTMTNMKDSDPKTVNSETFSELNQRVMFASNISSTPFKNIMQSQQPLNSITLKEMSSEAVSRAQGCLYEGSSLLVSSVILQLILDDNRKNQVVQIPSRLNLTDKGCFPTSLTLESLVFSVDTVQRRELLNATSILYDASVQDLILDAEAKGITNLHSFISGLKSQILKREEVKTEADLRGMSARISGSEDEIPREDEKKIPGDQLILDSLASLTSMDTEKVKLLARSLEDLSEAHYFRLSDLSETSVEDGSSYGKISTMSISNLKKVKKLKAMKISRSSVESGIAQNPTYFLEENCDEALLSMQKRYLNPSSGSGDFTSAISNYLRTSLSRHMSFTIDGEENCFIENISVLLDKEEKKITLQNVIDFISDLSLLNAATPAISRVDLPDHSKFVDQKPRLSYSPITVRTKNLFTSLSTFGFFRRWVKGCMTSSDKISLTRLSHVYRFPANPLDILERMKSKGNEPEVRIKARYSYYLKEIYSLISHTRKNQIVMLCKGGRTDSVFETMSTFFIRNLHSCKTADNIWVQSRAKSEIDDLISGLISYAAKSSSDPKTFESMLSQIKNASVNGMNVESYVLSQKTEEKRMRENFYHRAFFGSETSQSSSMLQVSVNYNKRGGVSSIISVQAETYLCTQLVERRIKNVVLNSESDEMMVFRLVTTNADPGDDDLMNLLIRPHMERLSNIPCLPGAGAIRSFFSNNSGRIIRDDRASLNSEEFIILHEKKSIMEDGIFEDLNTEDGYTFLRSTAAYSIYRTKTDLVFAKTNGKTGRLSIMMKYKMSMPTLHSSIILSGIDWEYSYLPLDEQLEHSFLNLRITDRDPGIRLDYFPDQRTMKLIKRDAEDSKKGIMFSSATESIKKAEVLRDLRKRGKFESLSAFAEGKEPGRRSRASDDLATYKILKNASRGVQSLRMTSLMRNTMRNQVRTEDMETEEKVRSGTLREILSEARKMKISDENPEYKDALDDMDSSEVLSGVRGTEPDGGTLHHKYKARRNLISEDLPSEAEDQKEESNPEFMFSFDQNSESLRRKVDPRFEAHLQRQKKKKDVQFSGGFIKLLCNAFFGLSKYPDDRMLIASAYFLACIYSVMFLEQYKATKDSKKSKEYKRLSIIMTWSAVELTYVSDYDDLLTGSKIDERVAKKVSDYFSIPLLSFRDFDPGHYLDGDTDDDEEVMDSWMD